MQINCTKLNSIMIFNIFYNYLYIYIYICIIIIFNNYFLTILIEDDFHIFIWIDINDTEKLLPFSYSLLWFCHVLSFPRSQFFCTNSFHIGILIESFNETNSISSHTHMNLYYFRCSMAVTSLLYCDSIQLICHDTINNISSFSTFCLRLNMIVTLNQ